jgi:D-glycero-alpha-D-manno-heptose-7-phosphate kinase
MIVSRAPLRVSLFGGGSDYKSFFQDKTGSVLGCSISKYVYVSLSSLPFFSSELIRLTYRQTESVNSISEIQHPVVREMFLDLNITDRLNVATMSDISGGTGLGGSSSFTVALKSSLNKFLDISTDTVSLAKYAIKIEREKLRESGGWQDQYHCSVGGFREYKFSTSGVQVSDPLVSDETLAKLSRNFFLFSIGETRYSRIMATATEEISSTNDGVKNLEKLAELSSSTAEKIKQTKDFDNLMEIISSALNDSWSLKRNFGPQVAPSNVDILIAKGLSAGAIAAKLCGAGGAGFILFMVPENLSIQCRHALGMEKTLDFSFTSNGVQTWELAGDRLDWS